MAKLNEKNENTQKIIHLVITEKCDRKCPLCCNKQYDMNSIELVTDEELKNAETIFLTGGEPFAYEEPCWIAWELRQMYPNIKYIYVYTNALELYEYLHQGRELYAIDGVTISIKNEYDYKVFINELADNEEVIKLDSNWIYTFPGFNNIDNYYSKKYFTRKDRVWQEDFVPDPNSIFRRWNRRWK